MSIEPTTHDLEKKSSNLKAGRGRWVRSPWKMPAAAWKDILWRTFLSLKGDRVGLVAAGVTLYLILSIIPTLAAVLALYGFVFDVADVAEQLQSLRGFIPPAIVDILDVELTRLAASPKLSGFGLVVSIVLALWGASRAHQAISMALDVAYGERPKKGFILTRLKALAFAAATALIAFSALALLAIGPTLTAMWGWEGAEALAILRWPFLALVFWLWLMATYRFSPSRRNPKWRWVSVGSLLATVLWLSSSAILSWYATDLVDLGKAYGSLAGIVVLLLWLNSFGFCLILGAELDSEIEHQTVNDTTVGPDRPQGRRGAHVADTLGRAKGKTDSWFEE